MSPPSSMGGGNAFALKFISGKYQGGEFPLKVDKQVVIGRSSELDMVLVEDMVSRRHAKIIITDDQIFIQDLGSTNGTYLDRTRLTTPTPISLGAPIRIGKTVIELRK